MDLLLDPFGAPFMQRALLELLLLAVPAGAIGAFVVLRRLAFATHALGVGAFPGVVAAAGLGVSTFAGGLVAALVLAGLLALLTVRRDLEAPAATGLLLAVALAVGALLVSDVFTASARVDTLLFGSLLGVDGGDLVRTAIVAGVVGVVAVLLARRWLIVAFDREAAAALGARPLPLDLALLALLALTTVAAVAAVGSLLASSLLVVPAATAAVVSRRLGALVLSAALLTALEAAVGLWLAYELDAPPGATVALLTTGLFVLVAVGVRVAPRLPRAGVLAAAGLLATAGAAAGGAAGDATAGDRVAVVTTTPLLADWVRQVGGPGVPVASLIRPAVDPHDFEPAPSAARRIAGARLVLAVGAGLDDWAEDLRAGAGGNAPLVEVVPRRGLHPGEGGEPDPHFWHDPRLAVAAVRSVEAALVRVDPAHADGYRRRADDYVRRVEALDRDLAVRFAAVPRARRLMVTDHDAFGYLARRYGITLVGAAVPSTSTTSEAGAGATAALIREIRRRRVRTLFAEAEVDPRLVRALAAAAGASVDATLYGDSLGLPGSEGSGYLGMMRHNGAHLLAAFREAPR